MAVERRVPGTGTFALSSTPKPAQISLVQLPRPIDLASQLEQARAEYREGRFSDVERTTAQLGEAIQRAQRTPQTDDATLQALAGSAATVRGLAKQSVAEEYVDVFRAAVSAFERAGSLPSQRGDLAADYAVAVALSGEPARAVPLLESAIALGEDSPDVRRILAFAFRDNGDTESARAMLRQLVARAPFDWQAQRALAELTEQGGDNPADAAAAWLKAGSAMLDGRRIADALDAFTRALRLNPRPDAECELLSATALIADSRPDEALAHLGNAVAVADPPQLVSAADLFIQLGAFDDALAAVDTALARDPDNFDAEILRAQALIFTGRIDLAAPVVDDLVAVAPDDARTPLLRGRLAVETEDFATAVAALRHADRLEPGQVPVLAELGVALAGSGEVAEALEIMDRVVALSPEDAWAWQTRGQIKLIMGDNQAGEADLRASLDLDPGQPEVRAVLGELLRERGADSAALRELDRALDDDPSISSAWAVRGELLNDYGQWAAALASFEAAVDDQDHLGRVLSGMTEALFRSGAPDALAEAERAVTSALERQPTLAEAHALLGEIRRRQDMPDEALVHLDKALEYAPDYPYALATRGEVLLALQRIDDAIAAFEQAADAGFDEASVAAVLGDAYLALFDRTGESADLDKAMKSLRKARRAAPDDPNVLVLLGTAYTLAGRLPKALTTLDEAVRLLRDSSRPDESLLAEALVRRSEVRLRAGATQDAVDNLRTAMELGDDRPSVRAMLAVVKWHAGDYGEALSEAQSVLEVDPTHVGARAVVGASRAAMGSLDAGLADLRAAIEQAPTDVFVHSVLRTVLDDAGRYDEAVDTIKLAVDLAPDNAELRYEYVAALVAAGNYHVALSALEDMIWRWPKDAAVQRLLGSALSRTGRHQEAVSVWERVVELAGEPLDDDIIQLAIELAHVDDFAAALATLDTVPQSAQVLTTRSSILADMGQWAEAIKSADAAIGLDDANPWAYQTLGWALQHGDAVDARRSMSAYAAALALIPDDPWAHKGLANAQYLLNHDDAATNYQRAVDHLAHVSARDSDLNALLGWCLYRLSRYAEAIDCLQRGVDDPDQRAGALVDLMMAYLALGNNDQAWQTYGAVESELRTLSEPRRRAIGWVGLDNLRTGIRRELSDNQQAPNVLESLSQFLSG